MGIGDPQPQASNHNQTRLDPRYSTIARANRSGGGIGTSPGINPVTPYTNASLDYRASWISGDMVAKTNDATPARNSKLMAEILSTEARAQAMPKSFTKSELPAPDTHTQYLESNGLRRSLATNIPDHPTAIQVNGLRQERTEDVMCPGYVDGVSSYNARTLCGNWAEERSDKAYAPSLHNAPTGRNAHRYESTYAAQTTLMAGKVLPTRGSNALTAYTHPSSTLATGVIEASMSSNKEIVRLGGVPGVDYQPGDARSASRPAGNYVNYQAGKQHMTQMVGGKLNELTPYETSSQAAYGAPSEKWVPTSASRCDLNKPVFQMRDPARDSKSKMLCQIKTDEFACERGDAAYTSGHILGNPVPNKQIQYNLDEYRARWTQNDPAVKAAGQLPCSEHRGRYQDFNKGMVEVTVKAPGHIGCWH